MLSNDKLDNTLTNDSCSTLNNNNVKPLASILPLVPCLKPLFVFNSTLHVNHSDYECLVNKQTKVSRLRNEASLPTKTLTKLNSRVPSTNKGSLRIIMMQTITIILTTTKISFLTITIILTITKIYYLITTMLLLGWIIKFLAIS